MPYTPDRTTNRKILIAIAILIIIGYAFFQARKIITGPKIEFLSPATGSAFNENLILIEGITKNISSITLNDRPIFIDENGYFAEKLLLSPGYNIVEAEAKDRFGKTTRELLELVYTGENVEDEIEAESEMEPATSTETINNSTTTETNQ